MCGKNMFSTTVKMQLFPLLGDNDDFTDNELVWLLKHIPI